MAVEILGGTQIELLGSGPQELPGVCVRRGRVVLMPLAKGGTRLRLVLGDRAGVLTFTDPDYFEKAVRKIDPLVDISAE